MTHTSILPGRNDGTVLTPQIRHLQVRHLVLCNVLPLIGFLLALVLLFMESIGFTELVLFLSLGFFTMLGITVGYHRLFTHRAYKTSNYVRCALAIMGSMAGQGPLISWVVIHRRHHECSDENGDPHSPYLNDERNSKRLQGFFHSHMGWMVGHRFPLPTHYAADLLRDHAIVVVSRQYFSWIGLGLIIPALVGGIIYGTISGVLSCFLWGGPVRMFLVGQLILSVNSICHTFGQRSFSTADHSCNNWLVAIPTLGEGWHNNHHAFPSSPFLGMRWWQIDVGEMFIRFLCFTGMAWDLKIPQVKPHPRN
jgi:stearoyl-CoA desaturase (delta-9 desaturase)